MFQMLHPFHCTQINHLQPTKSRPARLRTSTKSSSIAALPPRAATSMRTTSTAGTKPKALPKLATTTWFALQALSMRADPCSKWARTAWKSAKITRTSAFATSASPTRTSIPPAPESSDGANFRPRREFFAPRLGGIWKFVITLLSPSATAPAPHGPAPRHRLAQTPLIHSEKQ